MIYLSDIIPIFDSLSHPTFSGMWEGKSRFRSSSFEDLVSEMLLNNIRGSIASTYPINEEIKISEFEEKCILLSEKYNLNISPAWIIDDRNGNALENINEIYRNSKNLKRRTILKFNANYINFKDFQRIQMIINTVLAKFNKNIVIYICTYPFFKLNLEKEIYDPIFLIDKLSKLEINCPIVLLHGCLNRLLDATIYAQHFENIYLDLSFTLCRFINSSLINDLSYAFEFLDQKIIIGTDHPEYNYLDLRNNLKIIEKILAKKFDNKELKKKFENIMNNNLSSILES